MAKIQKERPYYGIWIVAVYCLVLPAIFLFSNPIGLYMLPICEDLGISQGVYSLSRTCVSIICAASYLLYTTLQKRLTLRGMVCMGLLSGAISAFLYSVSVSIFTIFIAAVFNAFINPLASQISMGNLVNNWFVKRNATVMSIIFTCGNLGGFLNAKLVAFWIITFGWRASMRNTMLILLTVMVLAFLVLRDHPSDKGLIPWGADEQKVSKNAPPDVLPGADYSNTRKSKPFYCLMIWAFLTGLLTYPIINIVPSLLSSLGYDTVFSGTALSFISIGSLIFLPLLGVSVDKWGIRPALILFSVFNFLSILGSLTLTPGKPYSALITSLCLGIGNIVFPMLPMFIRELFGYRDYALYSSRANILRMLGTVLGYPLFGFTYDLLKSYNPIFILFTFLSATMLVFGLIASGSKTPL